MKIKLLLNETKAILSKITGLKVVLDPAPVITSEPHLRVQFIGSQDAGCSAICLKFQMMVVGAGDGPEVFVEEVISASSRLTKLYAAHHKRYIDFSVEDIDVRMSFLEGLVQTGSFIQNEYKTTETREWAYYFNEAWFFSLIYNYGDKDES